MMAGMVMGLMMVSIMTMYGLGMFGGMMGGGYRGMMAGQGMDDMIRQEGMMADHETMLKQMQDMIGMMKDVTHDETQKTKIDEMMKNLDDMIRQEGMMADYETMLKQMQDMIGMMKDMTHDETQKTKIDEMMKNLDNI